jgi:hypothetical protein
VRYPSFRRLAGLLALMTVVGSWAVPALRAQDRAAAPVAGQTPANAPAPVRHWWESPQPTPQTPTPPASAIQSASAAAPGPNIFRIKHDKPGDSKPVILDANEVASWTEKNGATEYFVFLLQGLVLAQHGIVEARFPHGVAWVNATHYKTTGKWHTELYAEGGVRIDNGSTVQEYPRAIFDLTTRGEFKLHTHLAPLAKQTRADDPVVLRGRAEGLGPAALRLANTTAKPPQAPVRPVSYEERPLILPPHLQSAAPPTPPTATERIARYAPPDDDPAAGTPGSASSGVALPPSPSGPAPGRPTARPGEGPQPPGVDGPASGAPRAPDGSVPPSGPTRVPPGTLPVPPPSRPTPPPQGKAARLTRNFRILSRQGGEFPIHSYPGPNGETAYVATGGIILQVRNAPNVGMVDMEADRVVIWTKGNAGHLADDIRQPTGYDSNDLEVYLSGHVIVRQAPLINPKGEERTISANEVYYDVNRNVAIALEARMELKQLLMNDPLIATAREMRQTSINTFEIEKSEVFSSKLRSDPGLKVVLQEGVIEDRTVPLRNLFGLPVIDRNTGQPLLIRETMLTGNNTFFEMEKIPFYWLPHVSTNIQEPLGPVQDFNFGYNHIFGVQFGVSLNMYEILGMQPRPQTRWLLNLDYLSYRGPGIGTTYNTMGTDLFGMPAKYNSMTRLFGMHDRNFDILGGPRPLNNFDPPNFRGWGLNRTTVEDMPNGFSFLGQVSPVSDRNFIEQYYKRAWDLDPNYDTFAFLKQQQDNWALSALVRPRLRDWVTMTQDLPRLDGWLIGQDFFSFITYTSHVNAEYASLRISSDSSPRIILTDVNGPGQPLVPNLQFLPEVSVTDQNNATFRGSWMQEAQAPIPLGPLQLLPYGRWELTGYSNDLAGNPIGRSWEAGGLRANIPFTHLYPSIQSELWNVNGINHKIVASANYVYAYTNQPYTLFPQLDRLNDDAANQMLRDIRPYQSLFNPNGVFGNHGLSLVFSPYFNTPQTYAIRRLMWNNIDTLSTMEQLQFDVRQRWQTKRGFPGYQHIVDWMTLDLSASYFPAPNRDNFGHNWSFLQYNYLWNLGDRTAFTSTGWTDPFPGGVRVWTVGGYFNRPDRTNFFLGFRYIDPLNVRAATAAVTYIFSPKYAATASSTYDFGTGEAFANSLMFTRMGSDLQVSLGVSYNALQSNFNVLFNIVPNLLPANRALGPMGAQGAGQQGVLK